MISCGLIIAAFVVALLVLCVLVRKHLKVYTMMKDKSQKLRNLADSWTIDSAIVNFDPTTKITKDSFEDMKERLNKRIVNDNMEDSEGVPYGIPVSFINTIADHIVEVFDISHVNDILSQFDHFQTVIGDINLHFIHMAGQKDSTPILLLHGWPSSVWEFHKSIPLLVEQGYSVVVPSLPGYGFTDPPSVTGVSPCIVACAYHKLMIKLGYNKYVVHGGDLGSIVGAVMTRLYPGHVTGLHNTMNHIHFDICWVCQLCGYGHNTMNHIHLGWRQIVQLVIGIFAPELVYTTPEEEAFLNPISGLADRMYRKFSWFHVQTVMPDTLGYGLVDSPVALISWIGSPLVLMSARENSVANWRQGMESIGIDNVCATLAIFWAMRNAQSAMRLHFEFYRNDREYLEHFTIPQVPVAISNFPNEIIHLTKFTSWRTFNNIIQFTYHEEGGHFAHLDNTDGVVGDIISFVQLLN